MGVGAGAPHAIVDMEAAIECEILKVYFLSNISFYVLQAETEAAVWTGQRVN